MKILIFLIILSIISFCDSQRICRALALGGGGDRGAYEAGVLKALIEFQHPDTVKWNVVAANSAGAMNGAIIAMNRTGNERDAVQYLQREWISITSSSIYRNWIPGSILQGWLIHSGLFSTTPLQSYLERRVTRDGLRASGREFTTGAYSLTTATFDTFNQTDPDIVNAIFASCAIPGIFPVVEVKRKNYYTDAGVSSMAPISTAIRKCYDLGYDEVHVDVILSIGDLQLTGWLPTWKITPFVLGRSVFGTLANYFIKDLQAARLAFPRAKNKRIYTKTIITWIFYWISIF